MILNLNYSSAGLFCRDAGPRGLEVRAHGAGGRIMTAAAIAVLEDVKVARLKSEREGIRRLRARLTAAVTAYDHARIDLLAEALLAEGLDVADVIEALLSGRRRS